MFNPLFHFGSGLVGKREREYVKGIYTFGHQVRNAGGKHFGFSTAGAGYNHQRAFGLKHGLALRFIQSLQIVLHGCNLRQRRLSAC